MPGALLPALCPPRGRLRLPVLEVCSSLNLLAMAWLKKAVPKP